MMMIRAILLLAAFMPSAAARAQAYPSKPIRLVVPFPPAAELVALAPGPAQFRDTWNGVLAPAGMPAALVSRLHADIVKISNTQDMKERMAVQAAEVFTTSSGEFAGILRKDFTKWSKVIKASGVRAD